MKALVLEAIGQLHMRDVPVPDVRPGNVLLRTGAATICTSDINDITANPFHVALPMVIGHEGAGTVAAIGEGVQGLEIGDRVASHPVMPCGKCDSCRRGLRHLCDDMEHLGITRGGTFAEFYEIRADRLRRIPDGMSFAQASLLEPVCVCLEALDRANVQEGGNVLVVGDGPFGVMIARLAFARKPARVVFVGRHAFRLDQVPGAITINQRDGGDTLARILEATGGAGIDSAVLAVGSTDAVTLSIAALRSRGTLSVFSGITQPVPIDLWKVHIKELMIRGSCNDMDVLDEAMTLLADPKLTLGDMITHQYAFPLWEDAFYTASHGKDQALKVSIVM